MSAQKQSSKGDRRRFSSAVASNRGPILAVLRDYLGESAHVLEIGSGSGEHAVHMVSSLPGLTWQPSDPSPLARASIADWSKTLSERNICPPLDIDVMAEDWPDKAKEAGANAAYDAVIAINVLHIAPWGAAEGMIRGAPCMLMPGGLLFFYGPFKKNGGHTAQSNAVFDQSLRARNAHWGVRDVEAVVALGHDNGFRLKAEIPMPANNLSLLLSLDR